MATALDILNDIAPQFSSEDSAKKNRFIAYAQDEVDSDDFENDNVYNKAVAYYAAHLLELSSRDGNSRGDLTSEKEGDLSRSYSSNRRTTEANSTQYLESFNQLISKRVAGFFVSGNGCNC